MSDINWEHAVRIAGVIWLDIDNPWHMEGMYEIS